ncbi:GntR family transcriptional regulator [Noviherbaspirillum sedimenti]|nr:GntR family transcriptional regulator [Noviherbaspirillum sedimenti]
MEKSNIKSVVAESSKPNATELVRKNIENEIISGALLPGDSLNEAEIARRFNVSRTPAREALLQLAAQGMVAIIPRSGIYVARMSVRELLAMFEVLAELEGICAKLAARRMTEQERADLKQAHAAGAECLKNGDHNGYARLNADFHNVLYLGAHNPFLMDQILYIRRRTQAYRQNPFQAPWRVSKSVEEHRLILEAILQGDASAAYERAIEHISVGGKEFAEFVSAIPSNLLESHDKAYPNVMRSDD